MVSLFRRFPVPIIAVLIAGLVIAPQTLAAETTAAVTAVYRAETNTVEVKGTGFPAGSSIDSVGTFGQTTTNAAATATDNGEFASVITVPPGYTGLATITSTGKRPRLGGLLGTQSSQASAPVATPTASPSTPSTPPAGSSAAPNTPFTPTGPAIFVSPTGNDANAGTQDAPFQTLTRAQRAIREMTPTMSSDITVYLNDGNYPMTAPLALTAEDSGKNGHVVTWSSIPGTRPVLNGGINIMGWQQVPGSTMWSADVAKGTVTRQLYVNGTRAVRARSAENPAGFTKAANGFTSTQLNMSGWNNLTDVEIVGTTEWRVFYCGVASVNGQSVTIQDKCWNVSQRDNWKLDSPRYIENALELLDSPGEWYVDGAVGKAYYLPREGEDLTKATVTAGGIDRLISGDKVSNVALNGLTFSYAGWNVPSDDEGYVPGQTGIFGANGNKIPGNIDFTGSTDIHITDCVFTHLGAAGLVVDGGSQNVRVDGNVFRYIAGSGISIADVNDPQQTNTALQNRFITVENNYIENVGADYWDNSAVFVGYADTVKILHNEITNVPYSPITLSWGWGAQSYAKNHEVGYNSLHHFTRVLRDSAGVYLLGPQPGTRIHHNWIDDAVNPFGCLYPDEGTAFTEWDHNVCARVPQWLHLWTSSIHDNSIHDNWMDTDVNENNGTNNSVTNNVVVPDRKWPAEAQAVIDGSGLEPAYVGLKTKT